MATMTLRPTEKCFSIIPKRGWYIIDRTDNSGHKFMAANGLNVRTKAEAKRFFTEQDAYEHICDNEWWSWAVVEYC
jgi:hypothetical protein